MEISSPTRHYQSEDSLRDVYFFPKSNRLIATPPPAALEPPSPVKFELAFRQLRCGLLQKKTLNSSWQFRYFVLTPVRLLYFSDETRREFKGCFNLGSLKEHNLQVSACFPEIILTVKVTQDQKVHQKILLTLQCQDKADFDQWMESIKLAVSVLKNIEDSLGYFPRLTPTSILQSNLKIGNSNVNFWNRLTISTHELISYASHLDILFLRNKSTFSYLHRFFMRSHYDHVGLLLNDQSERPYLLEVVHQKGVILTPLENLISAASQEYEEIGYRKLISPNSMLSLEHLEDYVNSLIGKKYELSFSKLFLESPSEIGEQTNSPQLYGDSEHDKTYFCSQLIADIYLKFGVLQEGRSNDFWPKDFEEHVQLREGCSLSPLMRVELLVPSCDSSSLED